MAHAAPRCQPVPAAVPSDCALCTVQHMSIPASVHGGIFIMLALVGTALVVAGWVWWGRSVVALGFGGAGLVAGVLGLFGAPNLAVVVVAAGGGLVLTALFWRWNRLVAEGNTLPLGVGAVRLVGMDAQVLADVGARGDGPVGQVRVRGETWGAWTDDDRPLTAGSLATVVEVRGTRLLVSAAANDRGRHPASSPIPPP